MDFNRFDVSTKELVWDDPLAWLRRLGIEPDGPVEVIESEITTLTAFADKVLRVDGTGGPFLVNIELQSGHDSSLERTLWFRQAALDYRHDLPVLTSLILLRKEANAPNLTGVYERYLPDGRLVNRFEYQVIRLWREPVESFLGGSVDLVPLAPLADVSPSDLPELVRRMAERLNAEPEGRSDKLWTATYLLMGLRYPDELIETLLAGVQTMQESTTYQKILLDGRKLGLAEGLAEGGVKEARRFLVRLGTKRFGPPEAATLAVLEAIGDLARLEELGDRMIDADVGDWDGLLKEE